MRSTTCKGSNGQFLAEYHSQAAALLALEERQAGGNVRTGRDLSVHSLQLAPYQCRSCGYWHLGVVNARLQCMQCTDSGLFLKDLYASRAEAQSTADYLRKERKIQLYPYKCPHSNGWHLTKSIPWKGRR